MNRWVALCLFSALFCGAKAAENLTPAELPVISTEAPGQVSFKSDIAPIFVQKCLGCHDANKARGGYRVDTYEALMKPGESGEPPVLAGMPSRSKLFALISTEDDVDRMPQKEDPLTPAQVELIENWILAGAPFDGAAPAELLHQHLPRPDYPPPSETYVHPVPILALAFNSNGTELAASGYHEINIWNPTDGALLRRAPNIPQRTHDLTFHPSVSSLAAATGTPGSIGEGLVLESESTANVHSLLATPDVVLTVAISPDGQRIAIGGSDHSIHLFDFHTGALLQEINQHADWVTDLKFSDDGKNLVSASRDRTSRMYDVETGELISSYNEFNHPLFAVAISNKPEIICVAGRDDRIHLWNPVDGKKKGELSGLGGSVYALATEGDSLFSACTDGQVRQHSISEKKLIRTFSGHQDWVYSLAIDRASNRLAAGAHDGTVLIWNMESGEELVRFKAAPGNTFQ